MSCGLLAGTYVEIQMLFAVVSVSVPQTARSNSEQPTHPVAIQGTAVYSC